MTLDNVGNIILASFKPFTRWPLVWPWFKTMDVGFIVFIQNTLQSIKIGSFLYISLSSFLCPPPARFFMSQILTSAQFNQSFSSALGFCLSALAICWLVSLEFLWVLSLIKFFSNWGIRDLLWVLWLTFQPQNSVLVNWLCSLFVWIFMGSGGRVGVNGRYEREKNRSRKGMRLCVWN